MWYTRVHSSRYVEATHSTNAWLPGPIIPCNEFELRPITLGGCTACVEDGRIHNYTFGSASLAGWCLRTTLRLSGLYSLRGLRWLSFTEQPLNQ